MADLAAITKDMKYPDGLSDEECQKRLADNFKEVPDVKDVTFLFTALGLEEFAEAMIEEGYDDGNFIRNMEEELIDEALADVGMTKRGHIMRLKAWRSKDIIVTAPGTYVGIMRYTGEFVASGPKPAEE